MRGATTLALLAALVAPAGCGEEPVPVFVTFDPTIKDLLAARCVRCHGAGGMLRGDPDAVNTNPPGNGYFTHFEDQGDCGADTPVDCRHGARSEAAVIGLYVHSPKEAERMPPPPAPRLTARELALIDAWVKDPRP